MKCSTIGNEYLLDTFLTCALKYKKIISNFNQFVS